MAVNYVIFVLSVLLVALLGWLLQIGQAILLPIFAAIISVYILTSAAEALGRLPLLKKTSGYFRRLLVLVLFILIIMFLSGVIILASDGIAEKIPEYQANFVALTKQTMALFGLEQQPDWEKIRAATIGKINLQQLVTSALAYSASMGGTIFLIAVYATFLLAEQGTFARKLATAFPNSNQAGQIESIIASINQKIGDYLAVKTLINVILAFISFIILKLMGVEYAMLWALLMGLLNYIPYVGSLVGVAFPVIMTLLQFGSIQTAAIVAALLVLVQTIVGNVLEPRMIGKQVNLSPFVVMVALSVWTAIWGLAGAILAIPLTSMMAIIFASFPPTRPLAVLLADDVSDYEQDAEEA